MSQINNQNINNANSRAPSWLSHVTNIAGAGDAAFIATISVGLILWLSLDPSSKWKTLGGIYLLTEALFYIYGKFKHAYLNISVAEQPNAERMLLAMERFQQLRGIFELNEFLSGWFLGAPVESIMKGNLDEFIAYGFYSKTLEELSKEEQQRVDEFLSQTETLWGVEFPPGYNPSVQFMAHTTEPLRVHHKPLAMYAVTESLAILAQLLLRLMGFERQRSGRFSFYSSQPMTEQPLPSGDGTINVNNDKSATPEVNTRGKRYSSEHHQHQHGVKEAAHAAAEHALDASLFVTSAAVASIGKQYPHEGQQYHLPARPQSPTNARPTSPQHSGSKPSTPVANSSPFATNKNIGNTMKTKDNDNEVESSSSPVPIVFLHGVGFGVLPYLHFVRGLMKACPDSPFVVLEIPHVALRLCNEAASLDEVATAAIASIKSFGAKRACFVGHSYGTFVVSKIVQQYPEAVHSVALLDPVCLMTCYPQLLFNFIYKSFPLSALANPMAIVDAVRFFCSRDLTISQAFCRKFAGMEIMLWPDDLPAREHGAVIVLSGRDDLVPSELVMAQFEASGHPAKVMHSPSLGHGGLLLDGVWMEQVIEAVSMCVHSGRKDVPVKETMTAVAGKKTQ